MIDLGMFNITDGAILDALSEMDIDSNGKLSAAEVKAADNDAIDAIQNNCNTNLEWNLMREISMIRGEYAALDGTVKGMGPGKGGRFRLMVDRLTTVSGYSQNGAKSVAASIGRRFGKIPM